MIKTQLVNNTFETTASIDAQGRRYVTYKQPNKGECFTINGVDYTGTIDVIEQADHTWRFMPNIWRVGAYSMKLTDAARLTLKTQAEESATKYADFHPEAFRKGLDKATGYTLERLTETIRDFKKAASTLQEFADLAELVIAGHASLTPTQPTTPHSVRWEAPQYRHYGAALIESQGGCQVHRVIVMSGETIGYAVNGSASSLLFVPLGLVTYQRYSWSSRYVPAE